MKTSYLFDVGDSSSGPIGFCARIVAESREKALEILKRHLPESWEVNSNPDEKDSDAVEYIQVYFNDNFITVKDADSWSCEFDAEEARKILIGICPKCSAEMVSTPATEADGEDHVVVECKECELAFSVAERRKLMEVVDGHA